MHLSVCVQQLLESTHANTSLLTKQVAAFLTMNTKVTSTVIQNKSLHDNTLNQGHWFGDSGSWTLFIIMFLYNILKKLLYMLGSKTFLDQIQLFDQLIMLANLDFVSLDSYWHSHLRRRSYILYKQRDIEFFDFMIEHNLLQS